MSNENKFTEKTVAEGDHMGAAIDEIRATILQLATLETRSSDSLDFHELAVWTIKAALEAAYKAGSSEAIGRIKGRPAKQA